MQKIRKIATHFEQLYHNQLQIALNSQLTGIQAHTYNAENLRLDVSKSS